MNLDGREGLHNFNRLRNILKGYDYLISQALGAQLRHKEDGDMKALKKKVQVKKREDEG